MGQGQSHDKLSADDIYATYIQQQQNLIVQQQQQINDLYQMNLNQPQMPSNMIFQQQHEHEHEQATAKAKANQEQEQPDHSLRKLPSTKLDPYKVLGIPKQFDINMLKKAYLKKAMIAHPDRGGSKNEFQKVSIAYTVLKKKLKEQGEIHHHNELRDNAKSFIKTQPTKNISASENWDVKVFNKIYEENRIDDAYDDGYGSWMEGGDDDTDQPKMFQGKFNKDMFNNEFEKYKQAQKQQHGAHIIKYQEPEARMSIRNQDSLVTLGQGKVSNFTGETGGLNYTDYKAAFTIDSTLIDGSDINIDKRPTSVKGLEQQRSDISYRMSTADIERAANNDALQNKAEQERIRRLQVYDKQGEDMYSKVHQMLLR